MVSVPDSRSDSLDVPIAIVGGGPVGMGLAIELGRRGIRCLIVERYADPQPIPKGQNLTQRTMEHFYFWGAEQALRAARTIPPEYGIGGVTAYQTLLGEYAYDWFRRELVRPYYFTDNERLPQYATESVLRRRAADFPIVATRYEWVAEDLNRDENGVFLTIAQRGGGGRQTILADYVVGCDGSRSIVRERAGITQTLSDHDRLMVLLVFRSTGLHKLLGKFPGKSFYNVLHPDLQGYWQFFGRVDLGTTWFFHAPVPLGTTKDNFDFRGLLHRAVGAEFDVEFDHIGFWDLRFAIADVYRKGRVFVAGDAAHSHPPYGGYGINTGFEDAVNLGWKLAATLQNWGGPKLLDSYDEERRPVFVSTARDFIEKTIRADREFLEAFHPERNRAAFDEHWKQRQSESRTEISKFEPNYEGSSIVSGPSGGVCTAVGSHLVEARAGHHLMPGRLSSNRDIFEELGDDFTLLALDADSALTRAFEAAATTLSLPLKIVADKRTEGREQYGAAFILIRPDQFIAWASNDEAIDPTAILAMAIGGANAAG
jgi:2-polyprenyl-6-methoxyphenol hydroxylase-like FAD-dependent oxidoreductase